ncbi:MAG: cadmium resistance transporter [Woeseiaceae bacterium]
MPISPDWADVATALLLVSFAYAATNVDNLLIMATLAAGVANRSAVIAGFLLASFAVLLISSLATFIEELLPVAMLGYLGFVPISIGVYLLFASDSPDDVATNRATTWPAITGLLLANSGDTIFALGPLFAESEDAARFGLAAGFVVIAAIWLALILNLSSRVAASARLRRLGHWLAPWMMILIGLYILTDTGTDLV